MRSLVLLNPDRRPRRYEMAVLTAAAILAAVVFYIDTFTDIHSALAALYVLVILLSAEALTERGILLLTAVCVTLALIAYFYAHGLSDDLGAALRLMVAVSALLVTCALIIRNHRARLDLMRTNARLRSSEARYRSIFEDSRVALWERDYSALRDFLMSLKAEGVTDLRAYNDTHPGFVAHCVDMVPTVAANAAAFTLVGHLGPQDASTLRRNLTTDGDATFLDLLIAVFNGDSHFEGRGTIVADDGKTKLVLITINFPEDPANFNRVVVGLLDVTEREMTHQALLEAQSELARAARAATVGALSASLAHELNQPLGAISVNAQTLVRWLDRDPPDHAAAVRTAERMARDSQRAGEIIQNARSMLSRKPPQWENVSLPELVTETQALLERDLTRADVALRLDAPADLPLVFAVRIELQQVLVNLINNAVQAMDTVPSRLRAIDIRVWHADDEHLTLTVTDSGPGIAEEILPTLFKPFHSTKETGLGMGLAICRATMEIRGGRLAASNIPAGGAVFEMTIPIRGNDD